MRGRSYQQLRETTFDLYTENERLPWYYKALSTFSAWLVLVGYVMFSIAYSNTPDDLRIAPSLMTGLAATGVFLGYLSDAALAFLSRSLIFCFDGVLMPVLTASAVGLFSTVIHRALKKEQEPGNQIYLILPLTVALVATVVSSILSFVVYRKLRRIKELDARRRMHIPSDSQSLMLPPNVSREVREMVPDNEAQRRQLMHLLMSQTDRAPSLEDTGSTFRIGLPGEDGSRQRSGSLPSAHTSSNSNGGRFTISNFGIGRERSGTAESFKDPRERRREQIELGALLNNASTPSSAGLTPTWNGPRHSPTIHHFGNSRNG